MNKIYVGNLPYSTNEDDLRGLFSTFGDISSVNIISDRDNGRSKGFGFIEFGTEAEATAACEKDGEDYDGRPLKVSIAREPRKRTGTGGRGDSGGDRNRW